MGLFVDWAAMEQEAQHGLGNRVRRDFRVLDGGRVRSRAGLRHEPAVAGRYRTAAGWLLLAGCAVAGALMFLGAAGWL